MRLVISTYALAAFGGSETYLLTVAGHLERLGHSVSLHAKELGEMAAVAETRGFRVADDSALPDEVDAVVAQDTVTSLELADRYPGAPQLFVCHSDSLDLQAPPQVPRLISAVVVFNDRVEQRVRALAESPEIVRLRQPIDVDWFTPSVAARPRPRRLLMLGNYLRSQRREAVEEACRSLGLEYHQVGAHGRPEHDPRPAILDADIVVGYGRAILEAMACGRAAYVLDHKGGDGWVTPERYPRLEADGFGGRAEPPGPFDGELAHDLSRYRREMGLANRDLAVAHHSAHRHAADLVELLRRLAPRHTDGGAPLDELARLARAQWRSEARAAALMHENERLREELEEMRRLADQRYWTAVGVMRTRRVRLANRVASPLDRLRRLRER
jgi:hypothetical protein